AVRADDAEPAVMAERSDEPLPLLGMRLAERDPVLRAHERLRDRRGARVGGGRAARVEWADRADIGFEQRREPGGRRSSQEPRHAVAPLRRALRLGAGKVVAAGAGARVDEAERRILAGEIDEDARQDRVLEHVGETAGVEGVAVVHGVDLSARPTAQRTGATATDERWQVWPATFGQAAKAFRSFVRQMRTSTSSPRAQVTAMSSGRRFAFAAMKACSIARGDRRCHSRGLCSIGGIASWSRTARTAAK